jgi:hypothetical protein
MLYKILDSCCASVAQKTQYSIGWERFGYVTATIKAVRGDAVGEILHVCIRYVSPCN